MSCGIDMGVTANAQLLLGYIAGCISRENRPRYEIIKADPTAGTLIVRYAHTGNTYRVSVVQLDGSE